MFWWLYRTTAQEDDKPLIIWLQGGPGVSGTAYGNFEEIGPLDTKLNPRNHTWVKDYNILFIDNPVGTGFSYTETDLDLCKNNQEIAADLMVMVREFLRQFPKFEKIPTFILAESYGGKYAVEFANVWYQVCINLFPKKIDFYKNKLSGKWVYVTCLGTKEEKCDKQFQGYRIDRLNDFPRRRGQIYGFSFIQFRGCYLISFTFNWNKLFIQHKLFSGINRQQRLWTDWCNCKRIFKSSLSWWLVKSLRYNGVSLSKIDLWSRQIQCYQQSITK